MVKRLSLFLLFLILVIGFAKRLPVQLAKAPLVSPTPTPTPTPTPELPKVVSVESPDMKQTLTMKEQKNAISVTHTFLTSFEKEYAQQQVFTKTVDLPTTITIPFNAWSPGGNKYLFLKETGGGDDSYIVLTSVGKPVAKDLQTVNVEELFAQKYTDYKITDVTGWAAPTLLVVNTDKLDGTAGPSFWFDVTTLSFIRLSTRFN
ncbi:MAG: hypothetical protein HY376_03445 [Candidatus Blackburnbacteria bacterium]|nr:hypothetical protein [Candidatus Blackburnbacteria bacterium]